MSLPDNASEQVLRVLIGGVEAAEVFVAKLIDLDNTTQKISQESLKIHYFQEVDMGFLLACINDRLHFQQEEAFREVLINGENHSVLTTEIDEQSAKLTIHAVQVGGIINSSNPSELNFEQLFDMSLEGLDQILIHCGGSYKYKWSRIRSTYFSSNCTINLDNLPGIGYIAEFVDGILATQNLTQKLGYTLLDSARFDEYTDYYNTNWQFYYGTQKIFTL